MNNFDENKEFVKRPAPPQSRPSPTTDIRRSVPQGQRVNQGRIAPDAQKARPRTIPSPEAQKRIPPERKSAPQSKTIPQNKTTPQRKPQQFDSKAFLKNLLIFVAMLAGLMFLSFALLLSSLHVAPAKADTSYKISMEGTEYDSVTVNKVLYINLSLLSDVCSFTESGTKASLRFTAHNEEYVAFTVGSRSAKINGDIVSMEGAALIRENENLWIPFSFAESYFIGLDISRDEKNHVIYIDRSVLGEDENEDPIYSKITFSVKGSQTIGGIKEDPDVGDIVSLGFVNDLSAYEQYMNPADRDAYLILVNKTTTISGDYIPENLVSIADVRKDGRKEQMVECAEKALEAMFMELRSAGYKDVSVTSGYRSYNKQASLFNTYLQKEMANNNLSEEAAKAIVLTYSAFPGTSEHQTGLCCDMHNLSSADVAFAKKEAYKWLKENCHKFGFIIRYPEDKTEITGYSFEPWHYRFVGRYHATRMHNLGMCLEEYVEHLKMAENN